MSSVSESPIDAVRKALRDELHAAAIGSQCADAAPAPRPTPSAAVPDVTIEELGPLAVVRAREWLAWVLAVLPRSTDPVLAAAAELRAQSLTDAPPVLAPELALWGDDAEPTPAPSLATALLDVGDQGHALVVVASPSPTGEQLEELTSAVRELAPGIRRTLPGSMSWPVACLPEESRDLFQRAARVAWGELSSRVELVHLAGALLTDADLESTLSLDGPWPDPADGLLDLLQDAAGRSAPESVVRARVARRLTAASMTHASRQTAPATPVVDDAFGFLRAVLAGEIRGVRAMTPTSDDPSAEIEPARCERHPVIDAAEPTAPEPLDEYDAAAEELAVHLSRTDTCSVWLTGAPHECTAALVRLVDRGTSGGVPWLADRHLITVDPCAVTPNGEEQLATALTYHANRLALAISETTSRLGNSLIRTAAGAGVPTILLTPTWDSDTCTAQHFGAPAVVEVGRTGSEPEVADLLAPIADELATHHGVTLASGVLAAAATGPPPIVEPKDPYEALFDDVSSAAPTVDRVALGRARLDYACSRAALRPDRRVTPADIPVDPIRGLPGGHISALASGVDYGSALAAQIVDQPDAVRCVAERLTYAARSLRRTGPRAALLFAGPPGTGKTHTAGVIASTFYGDPGALIRIDCGALHDRHTINALLGAPPAYIGYDDTERLLTTQISRRQGRCVVLLDEIEKADGRVLDTLLGVLDTGRLNDLQQRTADASEAVFILTSNLGSELFTRHPAGFTPCASDQTQTAVLAEIRSHLRPELIDRIDDIVIYRPLTRTGITELTTRHLASLMADLTEHGYYIQLGADVTAHLARNVETLGVRGLRRHLETTLLRDLLTLEPGQYRAALASGSWLRWHRV